MVHGPLAHLPREEIVDRVRAGTDLTPAYFAGHVAIGRAPEKLRAWRRAGATILYLTSRREAREVRTIRDVLKENGFPRGRLLARDEGETYADVAARARPDLIVEDDCESIGGEPEMTYPHLRPDLKRHIRSVVVREFGGIDALPDDPARLLRK